MKLTMDTASLRQAVEWAGRLLPARPTMPILSAIVLEATDIGLTAMAFDYDNWAEGTVDAQVSAAGRIAISGRALRGVVEALSKNARVDLVAEDGVQLSITSGKLEASLPLMAVEDFPNRPAIPTPDLLLPAGVGRLLGLALPVAGDMESHVSDQLGFELVLTKRSFEVAATDKYRLFVASLPWPDGVAPPINELHLPLPHRSVKALAESAKNADRVLLGLPAGDVSMLSASVDGKLMSVRLGAGKMPNYRPYLAAPRR